MIKDINYKEIINYGFNREPKIRRAIYSFLIVCSYFIIIGIPIYVGYLVKVMKSRAYEDNQNTPPAYRPFKQLFKLGSILISYVLPTVGVPVVATFVVTRVIDMSLVESTEISTAAAALINGVLASLFIIAIIGSYLVIGMISVYITEDEWIKGLYLNLVSQRVLTREYLFLYIKFVILSLVSGYVVSFCFSVVLLAPIGIFVWFVYTITVAMMIGDFSKEYI